MWPSEECCGWLGESCLGRLWSVTLRIGWQGKFRRVRERSGLLGRGWHGAKNSEVLHNDFEWRDEVAAEKYRQGQARHMIGAIRVTSEDTQEPVRAYVNVTVVAPDEPPVRSYMPMKEVLEHPDLHSQMMADAFRDAQSFKQKYNTLERLKPVMDAIDKAFDVDQIKHEQVKMAAGMEASIKGAIR